MVTRISNDNEAIMSNLSTKHLVHISICIVFSIRGYLSGKFAVLPRQKTNKLCLFEDGLEALAECYIFRCKTR